jgi:integrase
VCAFVCAFLTMASVKRRPRSKFWIACYRAADGTRRQRTTKTTNKTAALQIALAAEHASRQNATAAAARRMFEDVITRIGAEDPRTMAPGETAAAFLARWVDRKRRELSEGTGDRYKQVAEDFAGFLGPAAEKPLSGLAAGVVARYRDQLAARYATTTANLYLKIVKAALADAAAEGATDGNPAAGVKLLRGKAAGPAEPRRALAPAEVAAILAAVPVKDEWHGIILAGIYTGQRLGDIASMRREDVRGGWWRFTARKTGAAMAVPLAKPLAAWLKGQVRAKSGPSQGQHNEKDRKEKDGGTHVFPDAAARMAAAKGKTGTLSNQFQRILVRAGLATKRDHAGAGKGRHARRDASGLSFHYLRHTATSRLKAAGVPESVAMALIGHESRQVSRAYTHLPESTLSEAIKKLVDG